MQFEKLLSLDATGLTCAAGVSVCGRTLSSVFINNGLTHSRTLLPAVDTALSRANLLMSEADAIAVTVGPGSFTGVKITVATAKGIAFPYNTKCLTVSSLAALACGFCDMDGLVCPVLDARRSMFYNALFLVKNGIVTRLTDDRQLSGDALSAELKGHDRVYLCGDGASLFYEKYATELKTLIFPDNMRAYIRAESMFNATQQGLYTESDASSLCAVYLRPPQAERERLERMSNGG